MKRLLVVLALSITSGVFAQGMANSCYICAASSGGGGSGTVTSVSGTAPISVATGTTTPVVSMTAAAAGVSGYVNGSTQTLGAGTKTVDALTSTGAILGGTTLDVTNTSTSAVITATGNGGTAIQQYTYHATAANAPYTLQARARGTIASPSAVQSADYIGINYWAGYWDATHVLPVAKVIVGAEATFSTTTAPSYMAFYVNAAGNVAGGTADNTTERMRIASTGAVTFAGAMSGVTTLATSGRYTNSVSTGNVAMSQLTGARFVTNGGTDTRYISDDGTSVTITGPIAASSNVVIQGVFDAVSGIRAPATTTLLIRGQIANGASAIGNKIYNQTSLTTAGAKIVAFYPDVAVTEKMAIGKNGQIHWPTGNADSVAGTATLVAGTVTVSTTAVSAASLIFFSRNTPGGVVGQLSAPVASITAATSFVINSDNVADTSTVNWHIIN